MSWVRSKIGPRINAKLSTIARFTPATAPVPSAEAYQAWFNSITTQHGKKCSDLSGKKLRRMVIMRRQGSANKAIAEAVGLHAQTVSNWLCRLPPELAV